MVNLELYRVFYTVARCGSLTKAAEELFISQPAVSQAVKQLETQLGTTLFNRTHRGMELSVQGGKLIYKKVEDALGLLESAENTLIELKTSPTRMVPVADVLSSKVRKIRSSNSKRRPRVPYAWALPTPYFPTYSPIKLPSITKNIPL